MNELFVKVTDDFSPTSNAGALVACSRISEGRYFSEKGWDEGELEGMRIIRLRANPGRAAGYDDLADVLDALGIDYHEGENEDVLPGAVCQRPEVRAALEARGFDSVDIQFGIVVHNWETGARLLWRPDTYEVLPEPGGPGIAVERVGADMRFSIATSAGAMSALRCLGDPDHPQTGVVAVLREALAGTGLKVRAMEDAGELVVEGTGGVSWSLAKETWAVAGALLDEGGLAFAADGPVPALGR